MLLKFPQQIARDGTYTGNGLAWKFNHFLRTHLTLPWADISVGCHPAVPCFHKISMGCPVRMAGEKPTGKSNLINQQHPECETEKARDKAQPARKLPSFSEEAKG